MIGDEAGPDDVAGEDMFVELGRFEPGAIPFDAVMRRGKGIRLRRRLVGAGALALAACLVVLAPVALRGGGGAGGPVSVEAGSARTGVAHTVQLSPPTYDPRSRIDFSGGVDGRRWSYKLGGPCGDPGNRCMDLVGLVLPPVSLLLEPTRDGNVGISAEFGRETTRAVLTLTDGEQITLTGITAITTEPVAIVTDYFELPSGVDVANIAAYGGWPDGLIAQADPRPLRSDVPTVVPWYRPDGKRLSLEAPKVRLAEGGSGESAWTLDVEVGSWTNYFVYTDRSGSHTQERAAGLRIGSFAGATIPNGVSAVYGLVSGNVRRVDVTFSDGSVTHVVPVVSGDRVYAGAVAPPGRTVVSVAQFDAAGQPFHPYP
ncbi:MAG: hypothetical protein HOV87_15880 [Catenulispora sp.]|nr:hypothetical protein [Catenulispora sp.]